MSSPAPKPRNKNSPVKNMLVKKIVSYYSKLEDSPIYRKRSSSRSSQKSLAQKDSRKKTEHYNKEIHSQKKISNLQNLIKKEYEESFEGKTGIFPSYIVKNGDEKKKRKRSLKREMEEKYKHARAHVIEDPSPGDSNPEISRRINEFVLESEDFDEEEEVREVSNRYNRDQLFHVNTKKQYVHDNSADADIYDFHERKSKEIRRLQYYAELREKEKMANLKKNRRNEMEKGFQEKKYPVWVVFPNEIEVVQKAFMQFSKNLKIPKSEMIEIREDDFIRVTFTHKELDLDCTSAPKFIEGFTKKPIQEDGDCEFALVDSKGARHPIRLFLREKVEVVEEKFEENEISKEISTEKFLSEMANEESEQIPVVKETQPEKIFKSDDNEIEIPTNEEKFFESKAAEIEELDAVKIEEIDFGNCEVLPDKQRAMLKTSKKWIKAVTFDSNMDHKEILIHRLKNNYDLVLREDTKGFEKLEQIYYEEQIFLHRIGINVNLLMLNSKVQGTNRPKLVFVVKEIGRPMSIAHFLIKETVLLEIMQKEGKDDIKIKGILEKKISEEKNLRSLGSSGNEMNVFRVKVGKKGEEKFIEIKLDETELNFSSTDKSIIFNELTEVAKMKIGFPSFNPDLAKKIVFENYPDITATKAFDQYDEEVMEFQSSEIVQQVNGNRIEIFEEKIITKTVVKETEVKQEGKTQIMEIQEEVKTEFVIGNGKTTKNLRSIQREERDKSDRKQSRNNSKSNSVKSRTRKKVNSKDKTKKVTKSNRKSYGYSGKIGARYKRGSVSERNFGKKKDSEEVQSSKKKKTELRRSRRSIQSKGEKKTEKKSFTKKGDTKNPETPVDLSKFQSKKKRRTKSQRRKKAIGNVKEHDEEEKKVIVVEKRKMRNSKKNEKLNNVQNKISEKRRISESKKNYSNTKRRESSSSMKGKVKINRSYGKRSNRSREEIGEMNVTLDIDSNQKVNFSGFGKIEILNSKKKEFQSPVSIFYF